MRFPKNRCVIDGRHASSHAAGFRGVCPDASDAGGIAVCRAVSVDAVVYAVAGQQLLQIAGAPKCRVTVIQYPYLTLGAAGSRTNATGSLMLPNGSDCTGARPTPLYAHGTAVIAINMGICATTLKPR